MPVHTCLGTYPVSSTMPTGSFSEVKLPECGADPLFLTSTEVANELELYLQLPSVSAQPYHGVTFTFKDP